jgi:hypothetical protein
MARRSRGFRCPGRRSGDRKGACGGGCGGADGSGGCATRLLGGLTASTLSECRCISDLATPHWFQICKPNALQDKISIKCISSREILNDPLPRQCFGWPYEVRVSSHHLLLSLLESASSGRRNPLLRHPNPPPYQGALVPAMGWLPTRRVDTRLLDTCDRHRHDGGALKPLTPAQPNHANLPRSHGIH